MKRCGILRQIDAEVAETRMGYVRIRTSQTGKVYLMLPERSHVLRHGYSLENAPELTVTTDPIDFHHEPYYTTDPNSREELMTQLLQKSNSIHISIYKDGVNDYTSVTVNTSKYLLPFSVRADTELLALCLALLPEERREYYSTVLKECQG